MSEGFKAQSKIRIMFIIMFVMVKIFGRRKKRVGAGPTRIKDKCILIKGL